MTGTGELTYRRVHRGSPDLLFACITDPRHLTHFWGPAGTTTPVEGITVDLRPGGVFETTMVNDTDGTTHTMRAVYAEIRRPERLVWVEADVEGGMRTTVTFGDLGDGHTEVIIHQTNVPAAYLAAHARAGFATSLDRFDAYLADHHDTRHRAGARMSTVISDDGTSIAYEHTGNGPALVIIDGAMCYRGAGPSRAIAEVLREHFTVYTYDRRGRGDSSDTRPYAPAREVDDLRALLTAIDSPVFLHAISSGAAVALGAAAADPRVAALTLYEPPYLGEIENGTRIKEYTENLRACLAAGRRGDAVALFLADIGVPPPVIDGMRTGPGWTAMEAIAPTLDYDDRSLNAGIVPRDIATAVTVPVLVLAGDAGPENMREAAEATAHALPTARLHTLPGQTHDVDPQALAPELTRFFGAQ